jgi:hypothetical protein
MTAPRGLSALFALRSPPEPQAHQQLAESALANSNRNAGRNTYIWQDAAWTRAEAARAESMPRSSGGPFGDGRPALWGLPISVKDCFDLAGSPTSCGVRFYRDLNGNAARDSWLVEQLRAAGAVIVGKTHLHPLAYGITGENAEFGDCVQPRDSGALTGGSSSGAAASVQEGSAVAAIGTDTGGSVRAPAALCGLAGYRATIGRGNWRGGAHLAVNPSTRWAGSSATSKMRRCRFLAAPFWPRQPNVTGPRFTRFAFSTTNFFTIASPRSWPAFAASSASSRILDWKLDASRPAGGDAVEIFAPLQAVRGRAVHAGNFDRFEPDDSRPPQVGRRPHSGEVSALRQRHAYFARAWTNSSPRINSFLLPCAPVARLVAGADHSQTRSRSAALHGALQPRRRARVAIPCARGGMQLAAARGDDEPSSRWPRRSARKETNLRLSKGFSEKKSFELRRAGSLPKPRSYLSVRNGSGFTEPSRCFTSICTLPSAASSSCLQAADSPTPSSKSLSESSSARSPFSSCSTIVSSFLSDSSNDGM